MLKVHVASKPAAEQPENGRTFHIDRQEEKWRIDGAAFDGDVIRLGADRFHVIWNSKSYNIEIIDRSPTTKSMHLLINGRHYHTSAEDDLDMLLEGMGMHTASAQKINNVKAPMPGLIQSIAVAEGDMINKGDNLLVLVAMKMENVIKSSGSGVIKTLKVSPGQIVEKNQVLLEFQ